MRTLLLTLTTCLFIVSTASAKYSGGTGEPNDPYQIATAEQLLSVGSDPDRHFILTADVNMQGSTHLGPIVANFSGNFNGNRHKITNLIIRAHSPTSSGIGLGAFGVLGAEAKVTDLSLESVSFNWSDPPLRTHQYTVGLLVGENHGTIIDCNTSGSIVNDDVEGVGGGLVGQNTGTISNCQTNASVTTGWRGGGLVGTNSGTIADCCASGMVTGIAYSNKYFMPKSSAGGLVGINWGSVTRSYATGRVSGSVSHYSLDEGEVGIGGLVGSNGGNITLCFATGSVQGDGQGKELIGGLVGSNRGSITDCYATGRVLGESRLGGLAGVNYSYYRYPTYPAYVRGTIRRCYSTGKVLLEAGSNWQYVGGLVGSNSIELLKVMYSGEISNSYFADSNGPANGSGIPLSPAKMERQSSFVGWDFYGSTPDGQVDSWFMPKGDSPVLSWQIDLTSLPVIPNVRGVTQEQAEATIKAAGFALGATEYSYDKTLPIGVVICTDPLSYAPVGSEVKIIVNTVYDWTTNLGDGTEGSPYQIENAGQLESLGDNPPLWDKCFVLNCDVDMAGRVYSTALIAPYVNSQSTAFTGRFSGAGHAILNLSITISSRTATSYLGLFGRIGPTGQIDGLVLKDVDIASSSNYSNYVGALAGYNAGTVVECSATGDITAGCTCVNGLVGCNDGTMINCQWSDVTVARNCGTR